MANDKIARKSLALLLLGLLPAALGCGVEAEAQESTEELTLAAVSAVRPTVGAGAVGLDVSRLCRAHLAEWRCPREVAELLQRLRLLPTNREFTHVCPSGTGSCRLIGVRHLMVPGAARVRGASAQISMTVISARAGGEGLEQVRRQVHLARQRGAWGVVRVEGAP